ncbi:MAG: DegV family protein [Chloroflexota bacterium]
MKIAVVTDSTADIPAPLAESSGVHVVPNLVMLDGESYRDGVDLSREQFYQRLPALKSLPTTATASSGTYTGLYQRLLDEGYEAIVSVHVAGTLSGVLNAASAAALEFGERVRVVDSQSLSLGLGFQALEAGAAAQRQAHLDEILALLDDARRRARLFAMLDTLEYVHRSGRVSWARARLGSLLRVKPFVEVHAGQVKSMGEAHSRGKGVQRLAEFLARLGRLDRLAILHTNAEQEARRFLSELALDLPHAPLVVNVTTAIGTHVGPNALGFSALVH